MQAENASLAKQKKVDCLALSKVREWMGKESSKYRLRKIKMVTSYFKVKRKKQTMNWSLWKQFGKISAGKLWKQCFRKSCYKEPQLQKIYSEKVVAYLQEMEKNLAMGGTITVRKQVSFITQSINS